MAEKVQIIIEVDGKTGEATIKRLGQGMASAGQKGRQGFEKANAGLEKLRRGLDPTTRLATRLGGIFAGYKIAQFTKDAALAASRHETLGVVMENVGKNAGYSAREMAAYDLALRENGIAMNESREVLARMVQAQMDLNQASKLSRIAQDAAVIGNINSSEALSRLILGIQSAQVEVLRGIGINVSFEQGYKRLADQLGVTTEQLTEQQKAQSRMNQVMEAGEAISGTYEAAMSTAGKQITSFKRYLDDFKIKAGQAFGPAVTDLVKEATKEIKALSIAVQQPETQAELKRLSETAVAAFKHIVVLSKEVGNLFTITVSGWNTLPTVVQEIGIVGALIGGAKARAALAFLSLAIGGVKEYAEWIKRAEQDINRDTVEANRTEARRINAWMDVGESKLAKLKAELAKLSNEDRVGVIGHRLQGQIDAANVYLNRLESRLRSIGAKREMFDMDTALDGALDGFFADIDSAENRIKERTAQTSAAAANAAADEQARIRSELTDQIKRLTLSEYEYQKWALNQELAALMEKAAGDEQLENQITDYKKARMAEIEESHRQSLERQAEEDARAAEKREQAEAQLTDKIMQLSLSDLEYKQWKLNQELKALRTFFAQESEMLEQVKNYQRLRQQELDDERRRKTFESEHQLQAALAESWGLTWDEISQETVNVWADIGQAAASATHDIVNGLTAMATGSKNAKKATGDMLRSLASQAINTLIKIGVQKLILSVIEKKTVAANTAAMTASMAAIEAAAAPAAMSVSIATAGGAAAAGAAAYTAAMGTMTATYAATKATLAGIQAGIGGSGVTYAASGGIFDRPTLTVFGEEGEEVVVPMSPSRRREATSLMGYVQSKLGAGPPSQAISVDIGGIHFSGPVRLDADMETIKRQIGEAVETAIIGAFS